MGSIKTGFDHIDNGIGGLKRGEVYFISSFNSETAFTYAASLCESVNSKDDCTSVLYTDSPVPYCACHHIHFVEADVLLEFLRVDLAAQITYEFDRTDVYIFERFDSLFFTSCQKWPADLTLRKLLYETFLFSIRALANEYGITVMLTDKLYENKQDTDSLECDFPDIRYKMSKGTFHLIEQEDDILNVRYINHFNLDSRSFSLKSEPEEILMTYPSFKEITDCGG